ncbi:Bax inhibitor-1/YccA family protein [Hymenobacter jeollabukensis]|uniref:Bax inhibitor-1/YccA family protein n=1 Tax=Hymenobacter jeollabukensis TaxID=2025313 RepID=A0A5R8WLE7_9BACT|nr:Bax inhibitor-1/YccA family protein [Hymenobacter jeollabukensis]TLM89497.1 Bax inhibitor-1/YccA family protein [Hymenobacter jeollabukensis]
MENFTPNEEAHEPQPRQIVLSAEEAAAIQTRFLTQVYGWMTGALAVTGGVAMVVGASPELQEMVVGNRLVFWGLLLLELFIVGYIGARLMNMSANQAIGAFAAYSVINGLTLGIIFMVYTADSIASTFFVTAGTFGVMSAYGYFTRTDLSRWGNLLLMALIGVIIATVVNLFLQNSMLYWITSLLGVFIFVGLTAYDTQKIKELAFVGLEDEDVDRKAAVWGALTLYLDFVNLFLYLLRLFGRRK